MSEITGSPWSRRQFIATAGSAAGIAMTAKGAYRGVSLVVDPKDPVAGSAPAQWAAKHLEEALIAKGVEVHRHASASQAAAGDLCILAAGQNSAVAAAILKAGNVKVQSVPEALAVAPGKANGRSVLLAAGYDPRGLVYALLDLADRVGTATDPIAALDIAKPQAEAPANRVRSVARLFTSDVEDKPWYYDREMWPQYLAMLAAQRFNRFHLALGIGYDFLREVTDAYFVFSYPFLMKVPGYNVRVPQLPDAERDRNLEMLRYISDKTAECGLEFQLGLWMHGYEWMNSPHPNYTIEGINADNHGPYCRDAISALLKALPSVTGVTLRVHGESGVAEGSYDFWKMVFSGVANCGRKVEIDMHAKGMDDTMMELAVNAGPPIRISPKYWGEHFGMPYHQADIRELERPRPTANASGLMMLSAGTRSFLRYGYGDLLTEDRKYGVLHRIWPGTQRLLIWGDPLTAAAHSRAFGFCGSDGVEIMEPLSFKGRRGSGIAGNRTAYADTTLAPRWDWQKYEYGHRVWGRLLYNPETEPAVWQRFLLQRFGAAADSMETALANSSRILPIVTTAHAPSAGNNTYWPEVYLNHSMTDAARYGPYSDSPAPRVFGNVSPLDPQLFTRINDHADALLAGTDNAMYTPVEVAQWIEDYAAASSDALAAVMAKTASKNDPDFRRFTIDIALQNGIGRFFAAKFRAGVLYRIFEATGDRAALQQAIGLYKSARASFEDVANRARGVYMSDITVGETAVLRGHWLDRLPAIDRDIAALEAKLPGAGPANAASAGAASAIAAAMKRPVRPVASCTHTAVPRYRRGEAFPISLAADGAWNTVTLYYRHVNQADRFVKAAMQGSRGTYTYSIPAATMNGQFPLQYYFELKSAGKAALYPGLGPDLIRQPYFVVM